MDELGFNKIAGAVLATALGVMVLREAPHIFMHSEMPKTPAYSVGPIEVETTGEAEPLPFPQAEWVAAMDAPRDADMMEAGLGYELPINQRGLKRGDLVFWKGHVGIMQSATLMIHANAFHMKVESEPLREAVRRIEASGGGPMTAIKRL